MIMSVVAERPGMGVAGSLNTGSRRETGVLRQHSRTVAAAAMAAEEKARSDARQSRHTVVTTYPWTTPGWPGRHGLHQRSQCIPVYFPEGSWNTSLCAGKRKFAMTVESQP